MALNSMSDRPRRFQNEVKKQSFTRDQIKQSASLVVGESSWKLSPAKFSVCNECGRNHTGHLEAEFVKEFPRTIAHVEYGSVLAEVMQYQGISKSIREAPGPQRFDWLLVN